MEEALNLESIRNDDYAWLQSWLHERSSIVLEAGRIVRRPIPKTLESEATVFASTPGTGKIYVGA